MDGVKGVAGEAEADGVDGGGEVGEDAEVEGWGEGEEVAWLSWGW